MVGVLNKINVVKKGDTNVSKEEGIIKNTQSMINAFLITILLHLQDFMSI